MIQAVDRKGYCKVGFRKNGQLKNYAVHRLVAISFILNPENKPQVNHKDANKKNNHVSNLEWATSSENMQHAHDNGLMNLKVRENHPMAKLKLEDISVIRNSDLSDYELAEQFSVSRSAIREARIGKTWQFIEQQTENK